MAYLILATIPWIGEFVRWVFSIVDMSNYWMLPFVLILYVVPLFLYFCVLAGTMMVVHWTLCRLFGARFDY
jgi:hypothetical protein